MAVNVRSISLSKATLRNELKKNYERFADESVMSNALWTVFAQLVRGENYVSSIARGIKKNKSIVSRHLRRLEQFELVTQLGSGIKQSFSVNWTTFTYYWLWTSEYILEFIPDEVRALYRAQRIPTVLADFYFSPEQFKIISKTKYYIVNDVLEPEINELSKFIQLIVEALAHRRDIESFFEAFVDTSVSLAIGLPKKADIDMKRIDIPSTRRLLDALYSDRVNTWLSFLVMTRLGASNIIRNHV